MKKITLMFMFIIASINYLFGQTETEHFIYPKIRKQSQWQSQLQ